MLWKIFMLFFFFYILSVQLCLFCPNNVYIHAHTYTARSFAINLNNALTVLLKYP